MEYISSDTKNYMPEGHKGFPVFLLQKNERRPEMAEVIIKSIDELKEIVLESLKDGTVISIRLTDGKEEKDD